MRLRCRQLLERIDTGRTGSFGLPYQVLTLVLSTSYLKYLVQVPAYQVLDRKFSTATDPFFFLVIIRRAYQVLTLVPGMHWLVKRGHESDHRRLRRPEKIFFSLSMRSSFGRADKLLHTPRTFFWQFLKSRTLVHTKTKCRLPHPLDVVWRERKPPQRIVRLSWRHD